MTTEKKILFDLVATQPSEYAKRHGGGKYGEIVFKRMLERGLRPVCFYSSSKWLNPEIRNLTDSYRLKLVDLDNTSLSDIVRCHHIDTLYSCLPSSEMVMLDCCDVKGTIHGLREVETPYDNTFWDYKNIRLKTRSRFAIEKILSGLGIRWRRHNNHFKILDKNCHFSFVTVSYHSQAAIKSYFPQFKDMDIPVFYSPSTSSPIQVTARRFEDKYFFMVSGNRWVKNCLRAIKAFDKLFTNGFLDGYQVRIAGAEDASVYRYKIKNLDRFVFMGYVDDPTLEQLYHDAYCFVYPSLNEGFGYPPLEAMRYGVPVLASPYTSIPEVCKGAAIYFNPQAVEEIMNRIVLMASIPSLHDKYSQLSKLQYEMITQQQKRDLDGLIEWIVS